MWGIDMLKRIGAGAAVKPAMSAQPFGKIIANVMLLATGPGKGMIDLVELVLMLKVAFFMWGLSFLAMMLTTEVVPLCLILFLMMMFEETVWTVGAQYMLESFPTSVRSTAISLVSMVGNVGALSVASCGGMLSISPYLPIYVSSALSFVGCAVCFCLPRRNLGSMVDTVADGHP